MGKQPAPKAPAGGGLYGAAWSPGSGLLAPIAGRHEIGEEGVKKFAQMLASQKF